ncbi:putative DNA polymerase, beta domain protein region [Janthinobacterium sp. HH01]|uniref:type VII toxin-antitoxin system MntA family adenylyltransferase antitoxin n=1 Tax=Janthinobacterium sp. HH01 TaxID=1198452 RepID=UPI0002AE8AB7|nr:nucleotidyltransferase domain-containing protein [Janthinobacterium sp. HH01]ELX11021.1 putative DNA polymerase, beta domain protein region [Janthinobacterium sp. HH01]
MGASISEPEIVSALRLRLPGLMAVYLFGSRATEQAGGDSDLDLAVLVEGKLEPLATWELAQSLAGLVGCDVDLIDLRAASTVLQYQVITTGSRLWNKDVQASLYECAILSQKTDLDMARAGLLEDIEREGRVYGL